MSKTMASHVRHLQERLPDGPATIEITREELNRCKRATVVLAECFKTAMGGKQAPLVLREDMRVLTQVLRRLEAIAKP